MTNKQKWMHKGLLASAALALLGTAYAQAPAADSSAQQGDPARWYQANVTPSARYASAKKEADAALKEALADCSRTPQMLKQCQQQARQQYQQELQDAKRNNAGT